jgi:hypothetical protein
MMRQGCHIRLTCAADLPRWRMAATHGHNTGAGGSRARKKKDIHAWGITPCHTPVDDAAGVPHQVDLHG